MMNWSTASIRAATGAGAVLLCAYGEGVAQRRIELTPFVGAYYALGALGRQGTGVEERQENQPALGGLVGIQFTPTFGVEGAVAFTPSGVNVSGATNQGLSGRIVFASARARLSAARSNLYAVGGVGLVARGGRTWAGSSYTNLSRAAAVIGVGTRMQISPTLPVDLRAELNLYSIDPDGAGTSYNSNLQADLIVGLGVPISLRRPRPAPSGTPRVAVEPEPPPRDEPPTPPATTTAASVTEIVAGARHTCARSQTGRVWCWGDNMAGQVAPGAEGGVSRPTGHDSARVVAIAAGGAHTCSLQDGGHAVCWGSNRDGQLGSGNFQAHVVSITGPRFTAVSAGAAHTCGLTVEGAALCWGKNDFGQLGDGSTVRRVAPTAVKASGPFTALVAGARHTCALHRDGRMLCWGDNWSGQVGSGMIQALPEPTRVDGGHRFAQMTVGLAHSCAITREGQLYCWGQNNEGQLGDGTTRGRARPGLVPSTEEFAAVAGGGSHTCALTRAGRVLCWGRAREGQLGDGAAAREAKSMPRVVRTEERFLSLAAGVNHNCGVTKNGVVLCWGSNENGELGTAVRPFSALPAPIAELR